MTQNIIDIIKEQKVNEQSQPQPTEKAQFVVHYTYGATIVFRFNTVKKGEKEYKALLTAWKNNATTFKTHAVDADMFIGTVDLSSIVGICFVDHAKRAKFIPIQY